MYKPLRVSEHTTQEEVDKRNPERAVSKMPWWQRTSHEIVWQHVDFPEPTLADKSKSPQCAAALPGNPIVQGSSTTPDRIIQKFNDRMREKWLATHAVGNHPNDDYHGQLPREQSPVIQIWDKAALTTKLKSLLGTANQQGRLILNAHGLYETSGEASTEVGSEKRALDKLSNSAKTSIFSAREAAAVGGGAAGGARRGAGGEEGRGSRGSEEKTRSGAQHGDDGGGGGGMGVLVVLTCWIV